MLAILKQTCSQLAVAWQLALAVQAIWMLWGKAGNSEYQAMQDRQDFARQNSERHAEHCAAKTYAAAVR